MELLPFIYSATPAEIKTLQVKANALTGEVTISEDVSEIAEALKRRLNLKRVPTALARKLKYASTRRHYLDNKTIMEDIKNGKTRRRANSYIKK
ncbi:hypothetical protein [Streptococcus suis]|uniref:hypothetical protein n=1 Tax=Streptococcus suis TaxID=1307 RepID=UPI000CF599FD|nr:hypothetical protein [Streptococcus suis]HEM5037487.1 hypothetical protein [Streptococcus suis]